MLGEEIGVGDAYARMPMSSLQAALGTQRPHSCGLDEPCSKKRRPDGEADVGSREYLRAPRLCVETRSGTGEMQGAHPHGCKDTRCIAASRGHNLLTSGLRRAANANWAIPPAARHHAIWIGSAQF